MSFLSRLVAPLLRKSVTPLSIRDEKHWINRAEAEDGGVISPNQAIGLSATWACVNLIAGTGATMPAKVYAKGKKGREELGDHALYKVLHLRPNSLQTAVDFWEFMFASVELWGNAYARVIRNNGEIVSLIPVHPALPVRKRLSQSRIQYEWTENGVTYKETTETMLHIRGFGGDPLGGLSTLAFAARTMSLQADVARAARSTFRNGMRPSLGIKFPTWLTDTQRTAAEKAIYEKYAGAMNAGRPFLMEGGMDVANISIKPEDAQMVQIMGFGIEEICRFFGVPPHMIGHTEKTSSWGTGVKEQTLGFLKFNLRRRLNRMAASVNHQLLTAADIERRVYFEFDFEGLLQADTEGRVKVYDTMLRAGAMTINEVRALENMPPVPGGDVPRMQQQNIPINAPPVEEAPAPQV